MFTVEWDEKKDIYGRFLAYVYTSDGRMVNQWLLESQLAHILFIPPNLRYQHQLSKAWETEF